MLSYAIKMSTTLTPYDVCAKAKKAQKRLPKLEPIIMQDSLSAYWSYHYACNVIKGRWPEAEPNIMQNAQYAYWYARYIMQERWLEAELVIAQDAEYAYLYTLHIIKGRWLEAEPNIMKNTWYACCYALDVIKDRWLEAEEIIAQSDTCTQRYTNEFFEEHTVTKDQIGTLMWTHINPLGYFAPASLFENKVSLLDMVIE